MLGMRLSVFVEITIDFAIEIIAYVLDYQMHYNHDLHAMSACTLANMQIVHSIIAHRLF